MRLLPRNFHIPLSLMFYGAIAAGAAFTGHYILAVLAIIMGLGHYGYVHD